MAKPSGLILIMRGAWSNKGFALSTATGKYNEAIKAFDEAIKLDPNDPNLAVDWNNKGSALKDPGQVR